MRINDRKIIRYLPKRGVLPRNIFFIRSRDWRSIVIADNGRGLSIVTVGMPLHPTTGHLIREQIIREFGYCNRLLMFLFNLFHEVGHYYAALEGVEDDLRERCRIFRDARKIQVHNRTIKHDQIDEVIEIQKRYRNLPLEAYCGHFALKQIRLLKERRITNGR